MSGKPAARMGDGVAKGVIIQGSLTVLIGSQGGVACSACPGGVAVGNPVNPLLGAKVFSGEVDIALPGPLPFIISRDYSSYQTATPPPVGLLGPGWWLPQQPTLSLGGEVLTLNDTKGRSIHFDALGPGEIADSRSENLWLVRGGRDSLDEHTLPGARLAVAWQGLSPELRRNERLIFVTATPLGPWWVFGTISPALTEQRLYLGGLADRFGRQQRLGRIPEGELASHIATVIDGAGRRFELELTRHPNLIRDPAHGWGADPGIRLTAVRLTHDPHHPGVPTQPLVRYDYTPRGELAAVHGRDGTCLRQFHYHPELIGRMTGHAHAGRPTTRYTYDAHHRVTEQSTPEGLSYRFDYQPDRTLVTDSLGRKETYHFAGEGGLRRVIKHERADGSVIENRFDTSGRLTASIDPLGRQTTYELDIVTGDLLAVRLPDGHARHYQYDSHGSLTQSIDHDGNGTHHHFDPLGRPIADTDVLGHTTHYHYPNEHTEQPDEIEDPKGGRKKLTWNELGQLTAYTDCSGSTTRYRHDRFGQLTDIEGEESHRLRREYNTRGQLVAHIDALGHRLAYHYDDTGELTRLTLADGTDITYRHDLHGRPLVFCYASLTQHYQYDVAGRLTVLTNENGASTRFQYDELDRLTEQINFDGRTQRHSYNVAGELTESVDADQISRYQYDQGGRAIARQQLDPDGALLSNETYHYDSTGRLTEAHHLSAIGPNVVIVRFSRDVAGRITQETQQLINAEGRTVWQHQVGRRYDELGFEAQLELDTLPALHWQTYGSGHLHGLTLDGRSLIDFERDKLHRETERRFAATTRRYRYDALSRPLALDTHTPLIGDELNRQHHYNLLGQLTRIDTTQGSHQYDYDPTGRLIQASQPGLPDQSYRFDPAGNRLFTHRLTDTAEQDWAETVHQNLPDPRFNVLGRNHAQDAHRDETCWPSNHIEDDGQYHYQYDEHGNLVLKHKDGEHHHYAYDTSQRLIRYALETPDKVRASQYLYDPFGRRIAKQTIEADGNGTPTGEVQTTWYGWDGDRLATTECNGRTIHTVYEPGSFVPLIRIEGDTTTLRQSLAEKLQHQIGITLAPAQIRQLEAIEGELKQGNLSEQNRQWLQQAGLDLQQLKAMLDEEAGDAERTIHLYHCDHLGTPLALIDEQGKVDWSIELDAWGNTLRENNPDNLYQPIRFQGQHYDSETKLHYNRHRYYDPSIGRYVSQDPIGLRGGVNVYKYPFNPIGQTDPTGLAVIVLAVPAILEGLAAVGAAIGSAISAAAPYILGGAATAVILSIPGDTTVVQRDPWGVPIDPNADVLSKAHENAKGDRTNPGYGGNCQPDEYDRLHDAYKKECGAADTLGGCSDPNMSGAAREARRAAFGRCARARENIMNACFAGGDLNHRTQAGNVWNAYKNCGP